MYGARASLRLVLSGFAEPRTPFSFAGTTGRPPRNHGGDDMTHDPTDLLPLAAIHPIRLDARQNPLYAHLAGFPRTVICVSVRPAEAGVPERVCAACYWFDPHTYREDDQLREMGYVPREASPYHVRVTFQKTSRVWTAFKYRADTVVRSASDARFDMVMAETAFEGMEPDEPFTAQESLEKDVTPQSPPPRPTANQKVAPTNAERSKENKRKRGKDAPLTANIPSQIDAGWNPRYAYLSGFPLNLLYTGLRAASAGGAPRVAAACYWFAPVTYREDAHIREMQYLPRTASPYYVHVTVRKDTGVWGTWKYRGRELVCTASGPDFETAMIHTTLVGLQPDEPETDRNDAP